MIKVDIVRRVASELKLNDKDALGIVDQMIEAVKLVVCEHGRLEVRDFGVFQVKQRQARIGRNPRNKKEYPIAPHNVVTFKASKNLKVPGRDRKPAAHTPGVDAASEAAPASAP